MGESSTKGRLGKEVQEFCMLALVTRVTHREYWYNVCLKGAVQSSIPVQVASCTIQVILGVLSIVALPGGYKQVAHALRGSVPLEHKSGATKGRDKFLLPIMPAVSTLYC